MSDGKKKNGPAGNTRLRAGRIVLVCLLSLLLAALAALAVFVIAGETAKNVYAGDFTASVVDKYDRINTETVYAQLI